MKSAVSSSVRPVVTTSKMASGFHFAFFVCLTSGLLIAGTTSQDVEETPGCEPGWTQFGSRCFIFYHIQKPWIEAERTCISVGGNLASIHSSEENDFLRDLIERVTGYRSLTWIGGFDSVREGTWLWSDGSNFDFTAWGRHEPNNYGIENCLEVNRGGNNYWNDLWCHHLLHFVCSKDL